MYEQLLRVFVKSVLFGPVIAFGLLPVSCGNDMISERWTRTWGKKCSLHINADSDIALGIGLFTIYF